MDYTILEIQFPSLGSGQHRLEQKSPSHKEDFSWVFPSTRLNVSGSC
jgi:hypothetical protein